MNGTNHSQFLENFRIAAGLAEGHRRGASFNDGDFYKWLEAASASLARARDPRVEVWIEEAIEVIGQARGTLSPDACFASGKSWRQRSAAGRRGPRGL